MKITSLKELQAITPMWRVLDSTGNIAWIGLDLKERVFDRSDNKVSLYAVDKDNSSISLWFYRSDLQPLTPVQYKGRYIGEGDIVKYGNYWYEVFGWTVYDGEAVLRCACNGDYGETETIKGRVIEDIRPLYPQKDTETIKIGNNVYNKQEVEEALANVKSL